MQSDKQQDRKSDKPTLGRLLRSLRMRNNWDTKNYDYYYLCPERRRKRMIPLVTRIRARWSTT